MATSITKQYNLHIEEAKERLKQIVKQTPLQYNSTLSRIYEANIYLKREDLQTVRSYKIRGAYNMMSQLSQDKLKNGVVCASAGNHAQGVAFSCNQLKTKGSIFMPKITPKQKIAQTKMFGNGYIDIILVGDTFDDCAKSAKEFAKLKEMTFIPPFDDPKIIEGQGTVGLEILQDFEPNQHIDYIFIPIGGGGLCSGVGAYIKDHTPTTKIIGAEPNGAPSMQAAIKAQHPVKLDKIDKFVDGASVQRVGDTTYNICSKILDDICLVPEGEVCTTIINLYNKDAIVVEPAGALSIAALNHYKQQIKGKNIVCIVSGSNNDINRMQEIKERSLLFEGLKHYFIIRLAQRTNALKDFVNTICNEHVDIVRFEYMKKNDKESGPALLGVELDSATEYNNLIDRMTNLGLDFTVLDPDSNLGRYIV